MCDPVSAIIGTVGLIGAMAMAPDAPSMPNTPMPQPTAPTPPPAAVQQQPEAQPQQQTQRPTTPQEIRKVNSSASPNSGPAATPASTWLTGPTGVKLDESKLKKNTLLGS